MAAGAWQNAARDVAVLRGVKGRRDRSARPAGQRSHPGIADRHHLGRGDAWRGAVGKYVAKIKAVGIVAQAGSNAFPVHNNRDRPAAGRAA